MKGKKVLIQALKDKVCRGIDLLERQEHARFVEEFYHPLEIPAALEGKTFQEMADAIPSKRYNELRWVMRTVRDAGFLVSGKVETTDTLRITFRFEKLGFGGYAITFDLYDGSWRLYGGRKPQ